MTCWCPSELWQIWTCLRLLIGNYVAVGSMEDAIQVWDLDVVNAMKPAFELKSRTKKRKRRDKTSAVRLAVSSLGF